MDKSQDRPKVGVAVILKKDRKVLLGHRLSKHGEHTWGFPGGHLELGESIEDCARRETLEEIGVELQNFILGPFTNDVFDSNKHYVTIFVLADLDDSAAIQVMEPEKCERWEWFAWEDLPRPLFLPIENLLKNSYHPFNART